MTEKISNFPGTPLSEKDFQKDNILFNYDELKAEFSWDTGIAIGQYLESLKDGIIWERAVKPVERLLYPRTVCEWCFRPMHSFVSLQDTGVVNTFSLCYVTWDVKRIKGPEIPAVIEIDGASPLHGIMHMLGEVDPENVEIGMRVQAAWKPPEERKGAITDILYFKPIEEASS